MARWGEGVWGEGLWGGFVPDVTVEIEFTAGVWTDVTDHLRGASMFRGRSHELDHDNAGTLSLILDNADNRFSPTNTLSPYHPNVVPMKRVRVANVWDQTYYVFTGYIDSWPLRGGARGRDNFVEVTATDGFKVLALAKFTSRYDAEVLADSPRAFYSTFDANSPVVLDASGNNRHAQLIHEMQVVDGVPMGDGHTAIEPDNYTSSYLLAPVEAGVEALIEGQGFAIEIWFNSETETDPPRDINQPLVPLFAQRTPWVPDVSTDIFLSGQGKLRRYMSDGVNTSNAIADHRNLLDGGWHHVLVERVFGSYASVYLDGVRVYHAVITFAPLWALVARAQFTVGADPFFGGYRRYATSTAIAKVATYDAALGAARVLAHYQAGAELWAEQLPSERITEVLTAVGWTAGSNLNDGITTLIPFTDYGSAPLSHLQAVAESEEGRVFVAADGKLTFWDRHRHLSQTSQRTFGDATGELPYSDLQLSYGEEAIRNTAVVTGEGLDATASDQVSIDTYFERAMSRSSLAEVPVVRQAQAEWLVLRYAQPDQRVTSMTVEGFADPENLWPVILGIELGDLVTVNRQPAGGTETISQLSVVESISHTLDPPLRWTTTFQLSPAPDLTMGTWGDSAENSGEWVNDPEVVTTSRWGF